MLSSITILPAPLRGIVDAPPSKSAQHRAILCAALAEGVSHIAPCAESEDISRTIAGVRALGATVERWNDGLRVVGLGASRRACSDAPFTALREGTARPRFACDDSSQAASPACSDRDGSGLTASSACFDCGASPVCFDCGDSASTWRMLLPMALILRGDTRWTGSVRLLARPMEPYWTLFRAHGLRVEREGDGVRVTGALTPGLYSLPGDVSSQFVSGLLLALPLLPNDSELRLTTPLESAPYVEMTLDALRAFGVKVERTARGDFLVPGGQSYRAGDWAVEGDWSQAAPFLVAGAHVRGLRDDSRQSDRWILAALARMGARVEWADGTVRAHIANLRPASFDVRQCPDIAPFLALLCARAGGCSTISGARRLRDKECDRLYTTAAGLRALGVAITETSDGWTVDGARSRFRGGVTLDCEGDHRMAMLFAAAASLCEAPVTLLGADCVAKSYPNFFADFIAAGGRMDG